MEQLRTTLAWIVRYHFWLLSGLVPIVAMGSWYVASSDLQEKYTTSKGTIETAFRGQERLSGRSFIANPNVNEKQQSQVDLLAADVTALWQQLYDRQRKEVLKWPSQLQKSFRKQVSRLQFGEPIRKDRRAHYTDYIEGRFDDLPKIIDANEIEAGGSKRRTRGDLEGFGGRGGGRGFGGRGNDEDLVEVDYTVFWDGADQQRIKDDLTWGQTVSHWQVWVTQEDLWVYQTLLRAIADTNKAKGADRRSNAAITAVNALEVGQLAAKESRTKGRIRRLEKEAGISGEGRNNGGWELDGDVDLELGGQGEFGQGEFEQGEFGRRDDGGLEGDRQRLLSRRYIDAEGRPISVAKGNEPLEPGEFGKELKRLPVRLDVQIDIRWLTTLVTELANADLQIKITEVRVNPSNTSSSGGGRRGNGMMRGDIEFGRGGGGFGAGRGGRAKNIMVFEPRPYMKRVIIQGVVLIYNPPNLDLLKSEQGDEDWM